MIKINYFFPLLSMCSSVVNEPKGLRTQKAWLGEKRRKRRIAWKYFLVLNIIFNTIIYIYRNREDFYQLN